MSRIVSAYNINYSAKNTAFPYQKEAFMACQAEIVDLRGTRIERIESGAFKTCIDMKLIYIPSTVREIADDAFYGCLNLTIVCPAGSAAEAYAVQNHIDVCTEG